jgi:chorismate mutase-like protein
MDDAEELARLRNSIDALDAQILELITERVSAALAIGEIKRRTGRAIYDPEREREILTRLEQAAPAPLTPEMARRIFERLIDECRRAERLV